MATLIKTDGTTKQVKPANGRYFTLEEKQGFVGGLIEFIPTREGNWLTINEEGKLNGLPINRLATLMYKHSIVWKENEHPAFADIVVGDVLFLTDEEFMLEEKLMEEDEENEC